MQDFRVKLVSPIFKSFRCTKACNSLDINIEKKSVHELSVKADVTSPFNLGLIVGASGSGKTTLAKQIYGEDCFNFEYDETLPVIEQFPKSMSYEECSNMLSGIGLTAVPCWVRPMYTLSNGQKARAIASLMMASKDVFVVDEWTSVVDRTVAKAMSNCLQKYLRKTNKQAIVLSCHYDVIEWLNPDWIIDCNKQSYTDRRELWQTYERQEKLTFDIRECDSKSWKYFSKYHYLSSNLPCGKVYYYGLYQGDEQIGFICYANYVPYKKIYRLKGYLKQYHFNRVVIHPDYVGLGLGMRLVNETAKLMKAKGFDIRGRFSSKPMYFGCKRFSNLWRLVEIERDMDKKGKGSLSAINKDMAKSQRVRVKVYAFKYIGD